MRRGYTIKISSQARKELKETKKTYKQAIISAMEELQYDPFMGKPLKRELQGKYSLKIASFRVIYTIDKKDRVVNVLTAGHRSHIYS